MSRKHRELLKNKGVEELREDLNALRRESFNFRVQYAVQQSKQHSEFRRLRRHTARVLTLLAQKGEGHHG